MPANRIEERRLRVEGVEIFCRSVAGEGPPTVFVHGNPTHSEDWLPFLEAIDGPAIAFDMPGWGRSERPEDFDYSMHGLARFVGRVFDALEIAEHQLVVHDWGAVALIAAQDDPDSVRRLAIANIVPLLDGYRWHWVARLWRRRGIGEALNATTTRAATALLLRQARPGNRPMPGDFVDMIYDHYDAGTKRAVLQLYRSADEPELAEAGRRLGRLGCPALVVWGGSDPYLPAEFGRRLADALPAGELLELPDAGHWPWIDRPDSIGRILTFVTSS